jgi:hypothetical protein
MAKGIFCEHEVIESIVVIASATEILFFNPLLLLVVFIILNFSPWLNNQIFFTVKLHLPLGMRAAKNSIAPEI